MSLKDTRSGTFVDNMKMPVHRWFRYSAGFSAEWVNTEILKFQEETGKKSVCHMHKKFVSLWLS